MDGDPTLPADSFTSVHHHHQFYLEKNWELSVKKMASLSETRPVSAISKAFNFKMSTRFTCLHYFKFDAFESWSLLKEYICVSDWGSFEICILLISSALQPVTLFFHHWSFWQTQCHAFAGQSGGFEWRILAFWQSKLAWNIILLAV